MTTAERTASTLQQELRRVGIIANEISLYGRFHNEWYADDIDRLIQFCESQPTLHLPDASDLIYPTRSSSGSGLITSGGLNGHALRTILVQHSNWYQTFKTLYDSKLKGQKPIVVAFGPDRCRYSPIDIAWTRVNSTAYECI